MRDVKGQNADMFTFNFHDVGRVRRGKTWIKLFDAVTSIMFVASLSCYDEVMFEDFKINMMTGQLELFDDVCNNQSLQKASMILFLNKRDLFAEKIKRVPLTVCQSFSDYDGDQNEDMSIDYIRERFLSLNKVPETRHISTHIICATDTGEIETIFTDVIDIVVQSMIGSSFLEPWLFGGKQ